LSNQGEFIKVISEDSSTFDRNIDCGRGHLLAVELILRISSEAAAVAMFGKLDINKFHQTIGHANEQVTRATAQQLGIALRGTFEKYENCAISKIQRKNIPKGSINKSKDKGRRVYLDISSIQTNSYGGSKYWTLLVDEATCRVWSIFLKAKSNLKDHVIPWLRVIKKDHGGDITVLRCDNAGENKSLETSIQATSDLATKFEYTAPDTTE